MASNQSSIVFGVGPGLGWALSNRFASEGMPVGAVARDEVKIRALIASGAHQHIHPYAADVSKVEEVARTFEAVERDIGAADLVVFNAGAYQRGNVIDIKPEDFEHCWKVGCFGGFLVGQAAAKRMVKRGRGTIIFTGATAALRGSAGFANLAVSKFGLRALAQSMARELGPLGIHVAFVVIDGQIESERYQQLGMQRGEDSLLSPAAIAETYWQIHQQQRSSWTFETDLRPWSEKF